MTEIPDWMPMEQWDLFILMRLKKWKIETTDFSKRQFISQLSVWRDMGCNIAKIINKSVEMKWQGLFQGSVVPTRRPLKPAEKVQDLVDQMMSIKTVPPPVDIEASRRKAREQVAKMREMLE